MGDELDIGCNICIHFIILPQDNFHSSEFFILLKLIYLSSCLAIQKPTTTTSTTTTSFGCLVCFYFLLIPYTLYLLPMNEIITIVYAIKTPIFS